MKDPRILFCTLPIVAPGQEYKYMDKTKAYRQPRLGAQAIRDHVIRMGHAQDRVLSYLIVIFGSKELLKLLRKLLHNAG